LEFISFLEDNKLMILASISIIILIVEHLRPLTKNRTFRFQLYQDLLFWFLILDHIILPSSEDKIEPALSGFFQKIIPDQFSILKIGHLNLFIQFIIVFLVLEFVNYAFHRFIKHNKYLWELHKVHHCSKYLNQFTDAKNHPIFIMIEGMVFILPIIVILDPNPAALVAFGSIRLIWGPLIHMNVNLHWFFPLSHILSSPFTHRWHHSKAHERCNYAGVFILLDVIFGTFYAPEHKCEETGFENEENYPMRSIFTSLIYPLNKLFKK